jgi:3'-5' exonuclease
MMLGVSAPEFYRTDGDWRWNNYQNRYHDLHVDVMDVLSGYGAGMRAGLGTVGNVLGLPGKSFLDREIYSHVLDGDGARVIEYCKLDTVETLLVFLVWGHHCGWVARERLRELVENLRGVLVKEVFEGWRDVARGLSGWPSWAA